MAKIFSQAQMDEIYAYFKDKMNSLECIRVINMKPLNECSLNDIKNIVNAYYSGDLSLSDIQEYWSVGDTFSISLSAMPATYAEETHDAQDVQFRIIGMNHDTLTEPINGKTKALLTFQGVDCLLETAILTNTPSFYWQDLITNSGVYTYNRRDWLNETVFNAFPQQIKETIKPVNKYTFNSSEKVFFTAYSEEGMWNSTSSDRQKYQNLPVYSYYNGTDIWQDSKRIKKVGTTNTMYISHPASRDDQKMQCPGFSNNGADAWIDTSTNPGICLAFCV